MAGVIGLHAQEYKDTTVIKPEPLINAPVFGGNGLPFFPQPPLEQPESKEDRAARINRETYLRVMESVNRDLAPFRPPHLTNTQMALLFIGGFFLNSPYKFRPGTVPVMNGSNPFMFAAVPGMAPYEHKYSPEFFPQAITTELDFASGTYKQVMVKWEDLEKSMSRSFGGPYRLEPVPRLRTNTAIDRLMP